MKKYPVVVEKTDTGYSAYSPDLDGCVATGRTRGKLRVRCRKPSSFIWIGMTRNGEAIPEPHTDSRYVEVSARTY
jgi:predicted RNase H-like HicB family nuclease